MWLTTGRLTHTAACTLLGNLASCFDFSSDRDKCLLVSNAAKHLLGLIERLLSPNRSDLPMYVGVFQQCLVSVSEQKLQSCRTTGSMTLWHNDCDAWLSARLWNPPIRIGLLCCDSARSYKRLNRLPVLLLSQAARMLFLPVYPPGVAVLFAVHCMRAQRQVAACVCQQAYACLKQVASCHSQSNLLRRLVDHLSYSLVLPLALSAQHCT